MVNDIFEIITDSIVLKELFNNYSKELNYAKSIKYEDTIDAIKQIIEILDSKIIDV